MPSKALENRQPIVHKTNMERLCKLVYLRHSFVNSLNNELCCFALLVFGRIKEGKGEGGLVEITCLIKRKIQSLTHSLAYKLFEIS